jgi:hypothetical protein
VVPFYLPPVQQGELSWAEVTLQLFDEQGRMVYEQKSEFPFGMNQFVLDGDKLPAEGLFYCNLRSGSRSASLKMVKYDRK